MPFMYVIFFLVFCGLVYLSLPFWKHIGGAVLKHTDKSFTDEEGREVKEDESVQQQQRPTEETQGTP